MTGAWEPISCFKYEELRADPAMRVHSAPKRIQRHRTKGWRMPEGAIYVGRPTIWGNPYRVVRQGKTTWDVYAFEESSPTASFVSRTGVEARAFAVEPCHADVLLEIANRGEAT